jgi:hypothetical protein
MNVNQFVSCRSSELNRFVEILQKEKNSVPLRLRTPHPIRPASYEKLPSSLNVVGTEPVRAIKHSPFRNCGQFLENTSVALMKTTSKEKQLTVRDELNEKILPKKNIKKKMKIVKAKKEENDDKVLQVADTKMKRLIKAKRRRGKRSLSRALAVTKYGFRFCLDRQTGARRCRVYLPCHRFLAKRFKFVDFDNNNYNCDNNNIFQKYPFLFPPHSKNENVCAEFHLRIPEASFSSKSYKRIQKAKISPICAIFDVSFSVSCKFLGNISKKEEIVKLIQENINKNSKNNLSIKPLGDGKVVTKIRSLNEQGDRIVSLQESPVSLVSICDGINIAVAEKKNNCYSCFAIFDEQKRNRRQREENNTRTKFEEDDEDEKQSGARQIQQSPFCLMLEGTASNEKAINIVKKNASFYSSTAVISLSSASSPSSSLKTMIIDLPLLSGNTVNVCEGLDERQQFSLKYKLYSKMFRDGVILFGAIPGGRRDL